MADRRYLCVHCDERFTHEGEKRPRCPKCMRKNGIEKIADEADDARPKWILPAAVATVVALGVGAYVVWARETPDSVTGDVPFEPLERSQLAGHLRRLRVQVDEDWLGFLEADDAVEELASDAVEGRETNVAKAEGVVEAIRARASKRAFVVWGLSHPRDTPLRTAAATMGVLSEDDGRARLYPLEVAAVAVAALRSEGVDAMVAEVARFPGDRSPPDPSGHFGYYGVAVYAETVGEGTPEVFDPYGGRGTEPEDDDVRVLNDVQVLGAVENHLAIHRLVREGEPALALARSESALALDPRSPQTHSVAGAVLLLGGGAEQGQAEFEAAFQLRPDAPRHNQMAGLALAGQPPDLERANREVAAALEQHEDYAAARLTMAAIHLARRETDEAARELERAEGLDPDLPNLAMMWANYYLTTNEPERAAEKAEEAIEAQPHDWRSRLSAARVLRAAGRFDAMRAQARAIMEMVSGAERSRVEQLILHPDVLGPTALEDDIFDEEIGDEELGALHEGGFQLGADSALLGEGEEPAFGGSLLGDEELGEGLPNLGDPSRLRLGSGGSGPRLDLSE